jgi:hypothetical protein
MKHAHRGYCVEGDGHFSMMKIKQVGQGPVPKPLQGLFSNLEIALSAIDAFENSKVPKVKKRKLNGKANSPNKD